MFINDLNIGVTVGIKRPDSDDIYTSKVLSKEIKSVGIRGIADLVLSTGDTVELIFYKESFLVIWTCTVKIIRNAITLYSDVKGKHINRREAYRLHLPIKAIVTNSEGVKALIFIKDISLLGLGFYSNTLCDVTQMHNIKLRDSDFDLDIDFEIVRLTNNVKSSIYQYSYGGKTISDNNNNLEKYMAKKQIEELKRNKLFR